MPEPTVVGDGGRLQKALAHIGSNGDVLVTAIDRGRDGSVTRLGRSAVAEGRAWLPVAVELDHVVIGPLVRADGSGCAHCAARRRNRLRCGRDEERVVWQDHGHDLLGRVATCTEATADTVAGLVSAELAALADQGLAASRLNGAFLTVDRRALKIARHAFLPDPHCEVCGGLADDTEAAAKIMLRHAPKPAVEAFRAMDLSEREDVLRLTYLDPVAGFMPGTTVTINSVFPLAEVPVTTADGALTDKGYGHATDFRSTRLIALAEALERFGGRRPGAKRTVTRGSYRELRSKAIDPRTLGLFDQGGQRCALLPYDEDLVFPWVWAFSFGRDEAVLVPEQCAYYDSTLSPGERFVHDTSNGCALGGTLEEAILHGLLEVAERDAFLMTWYARMRAPRVDLDSLADDNCRFVLSHLRDVCGMRVHAFATILEQGIPCYWVMAVDSTGDPDRPQLLCGEGSGLTHEKALINAIRELAVMCSVVANNYRDPQQRRRAAAMVADSRLVRQMSDHTLLYSDPGARERLDFLIDAPGPGQSVADLAERLPWPASLDLRDDVAEMVYRYRRSGLDVIVVDQTTAEHRAGGFHAVKVLVPGTLPMTFGHGNRRVAGLPRLLEVPAALGYRDHRLDFDDLNPYPHPFP